jgi:hypothetical protein
MTIRYQNFAHDASARARRLRRATSRAEVDAVIELLRPLGATPQKFAQGKIDKQQNDKGAGDDEYNSR